MFTAGEALNANASGQANLTAVDGAITGPLTFMLNGGTFTTATFDLLGTGSVLIQALFGDTVLGGSTVNLSESGTNFFGITATGSELFTGFRLTSQTGTLTEVRQVRLGGVQTAVPEPGTWALMLIGFGVSAEKGGAPLLSAYGAAPCRAIRCMGRLCSLRLCLLWVESGHSIQQPWRGAS
jgi:hypothetical protein